MIEPPYTRLANGEQAARDRFPAAVACRAIWTPNSNESDVHVEVWTHDERTGHARADIWTPAGSDLTTPVQIEIEAGARIVTNVPVKVLA